MDNSVYPRLKNRVAIVTGSGRGIGESIAHRLAAEGAHVAVVGRSLLPIEQTVADIRRAGGSALAISADIADQDDVERLYTLVGEEWGRLDILVNNAARFDEPPFLELDLATVELTYRTNVFGTLLMSQHAARHMVDTGSGSIIHISSIDSLAADGPFTAYSSTKAAVASIARTMAAELSPLGVRVNCVAPGFVNTDMVHKTSTPEVIDHMLNNFTRVPIRRLVEPEEIAASVAFLASDDASAITGSNLVVDGGLTTNLFVMETLPEPMLPFADD